MSEITLDDLNELLNMQESRVVDYKKEHYRFASVQITDNQVKDRAKIEFAKDVTGFANGVGGDLYIGVDEDGKGVATQVCGIKLPNPDATIQQIIQILTAKTTPVVSVEPRAIRIDDDDPERHVLVVRVPQSSIGPHAVIDGNTNLYFVRRTVLVDHMDREELRHAFTLTEIAADRIRNFRNGRIEAFQRFETPVKRVPGERPTLFLHLLPQLSFASRFDCPVSRLRDTAVELKLWPIGVHTTEDEFSRWRFNLDGVVETVSRERECTSSLQLYRNGSVEAIWRLEASEQLIQPSQIAESFRRNVPMYREFQNRIGAGVPVWSFVSLVDVGGFELGYVFRQNNTFDRDVLNLSEVEFESADDGKTSDAIDSLLNLIWNCANYDECSLSNFKASQ